MIVYFIVIHSLLFNNFLFGRWGLGAGVELFLPLYINTGNVQYVGPTFFWIV